MDKLHIQKDAQKTEELAGQDPVLGQLIDWIGSIQLPMRPDYFASIVRSITGQQISVPAASAVYGRLEDLAGKPLTPEAIEDVSDQELKTAGLSWKKIEYVRDLLDHIESGRIRMNEWEHATNQEVMEELTSVKGIGKWTAEMFLMFTLGRKDVLAVDDVGIQRGARWLYGVEKSERKKILEEKRPIWYPHLTIASCYLWETIHLGWERDYDSFQAMIEASIDD